ncbi:glycosyltransferase [Bacillus sp. S14(2024)]|uniref:glycosyltransferase n=1 Tax=Bacillus sp. S14(2024) TaxID=3162884 RepID=UPI003D25CA74
MEKILYVAFIREDSESLGFVKKVYAQCRALSKLGSKSYLYISRKDSAELYEFSVEKVEKVYSLKYSDFSCFKETNFLLMKAKNLLRFREYLLGLYKVINLIEPNKVYIRRIIPVTNSLVKLVKYLDQQGIKTFYEYPDFPDIPWIRPEKKTISNQVKYIFEKKQVAKLKKYLYKLVAISVDESITDEHIEIIYIRNGIDINNIPMTMREKQESEINLVGVANIGFWHAYDRVIKGLYEYYHKNSNQVKVKFHIVGDGKGKEQLEQMVNYYNLKEYVVFHGSKNGQELDVILNHSDIGIGILGNHRKELYGDSSLKNREYCARGIPFVIAAKDLDFPDELEFVHRIKADESAVNIEELIAFYHNLDELNFRRNMKIYAEQNLQWEDKMNPIICN